MENNKCKKGDWLTARVPTNRGDIAFLHLTNVKLIVLHRGHSPWCSDMFCNEFLELLPVGRRLNVFVNADGSARYFKTERFRNNRLHSRAMQRARHGDSYGQITDWLCHNKQVVC